MVTLVRQLHVAIWLDWVLQEMTLACRCVNVSLECCSHETAIMAFTSTSLLETAYCAPLLSSRVLLSLSLTFIWVH